MKVLLFFLLIGINLLALTDAEVEIPQPAEIDFVKGPHVLEVVEAAQNAVRNDPNAAEAWGKLGHVYLIYGWEALAEPCYQRASVLAPDAFRWHYFSGRIVIHGNPEEAVNIFKRALQLDPTYAPAHLYLASALRTLRRFDEAQHHLERAKHLQPDNPFSDLWLGAIALARQQMEQAEEHLHRALTLNPNQSEAHTLLAQVYFALEEPVFAKQHADAARQPSQHVELADPLWWFEPRVSSFPKDADSWTGYGSEFIRIKRYDEAITALKRAQALLQSGEWENQDEKTTDVTYLQVQVHYYLAHIHHQRRHIAAAIQNYKNAIQVMEAPNTGVNTPDSAQKSQPNPSEHLIFFSNVYANLAGVYEEVGQLGKAIEQYQKALSLVPTDPVLHRKLAGIYWKTEQHVKAEQHYKSVIAQDTTDVEVLYRLGLISLMKTDPIAAAAQFEKVLELDAGYVEAYRGLGIAQKELGNFAEAVSAFETLLELNPEDQLAQEMLQHLK